MPAVDSVYYQSLRPFEARFGTGLPILTYHKLGPRPRHTRLKGLYLSQRLFAGQLAELRQAGFESSSLGRALLDVAQGQADRHAGEKTDPSPQPSPLRKGRASIAGSVAEGDPRNGETNRKIVLTFDDGFQNVLEFGLEPLAEHKCRAMQFLVADRLGGRNEWDLAEGETPAPLMDETQVRDWLAAGHEIGSHTLTHPWLTRLPVGEAREEIAASRKKLEDRFGVPIQHFCYPYGDWNESVRELVQASGYMTACTTNPGVNTAADSPFALKRFTARYPSRNLKAFWSRLRGG